MNSIVYKNQLLLIIKNIVIQHYHRLQVSMASLELRDSWCINGIAFAVYTSFYAFTFFFQCIAGYTEVLLK